MDELYVLARRVLLDALDALGSHREAAVVVGAHAACMRAGDKGTETPERACEPEPEKALESQSVDREFTL